MNTFVRGRGALIAIASLAMLGCGRGTQGASGAGGVSQASGAGQAGGASGASDTASARVTDYPRPAKPTKRYRIGVAVPHLSNPHYVGQAYGYLDEAQSLGAQVTLLEAGGYQYLDKQVSQIEDLIASKVDAIILAAVSGPGTVGAVEAAVAAGVPVINVNVMTDSDKVVTRKIGRAHV